MNDFEGLSVFNPKLIPAYNVVINELGVKQILWCNKGILEYIRVKNSRGNEKK
jgi:hypothetical protein